MSDSESLVALPLSKIGNSQLMSVPRISFMQANATPKLGGARVSSNDLQAFSNMRASFSKPQYTQPEQARKSVFAMQADPQPSVNDLLKMMQEMKEMVRDVTKLAET